MWLLYNTRGNGSISEYEYEHIALVHVRSHSEKFVCDSAYSPGHSVSLSLLTRLNSCFDDDATAQPRAVNILSRIIHLPPSRRKSYRSSMVTHCPKIEQSIWYQMSKWRILSIKSGQIPSQNDSSKLPSFDGIWAAVWCLHTAWHGHFRGWWKKAQNWS